MITSRQYVALHLYYVKGETERSIARVLGINPGAMHRLLVRGRRWIIEEAAQGGSNSRICRGLLQPSPTTSVTGRSGIAASRQDELWDSLELRMQTRAKELADIEQCMSHDSTASARKTVPSGGGVSIGPGGTCWPAEKWQHQDGRVEVLPQDD